MFSVNFSHKVIKIICKSSFPFVMSAIKFDSRSMHFVKRSKRPLSMFLSAKITLLLVTLVLTSINTAAENEKTFTYNRKCIVLIFRTLMFYKLIYSTILVYLQFRKVNFLVRFLNDFLVLIVEFDKTIKRHVFSTKIITFLLLKIGIGVCMILAAFARFADKFEVMFLLHIALWCFNILFCNMICTGMLLFGSLHRMRFSHFKGKQIFQSEEMESMLKMSLNLDKLLNQFTNFISLPIFLTIVLYTVNIMCGLTLIIRSQFELDLRTETTVFFMLFSLIDILLFFAAGNYMTVGNSLKSLYCFEVLDCPDNKMLVRCFFFNNSSDNNLYLNLVAEQIRNTCDK